MCLAGAAQAREVGTRLYCARLSQPPKPKSAVSLPKWYAPQPLRLAEVAAARDHVVVDECREPRERVAEHADAAAEAELGQDLFVFSS